MWKEDIGLDQKHIVPLFLLIKAVLKCSQKGHTYSNYSPHFPAIPLITSAHEIYIIVTVIKCSDLGSTAPLAIQVAFSSAPQEPPLCPCFLDQPAMICLVLDTRLDASNLCDVDRSTLPVLRFSDFDSFCIIGFHELHQSHQAAFTETLGAAEVSKNTNINSLKPRFA